MGAPCPAFGTWNTLLRSPPHPLSDNRVRNGKKLRVGILFGGRSGEHEVSLLSAASILNAIDRKKFDVTPSASPNRAAGWPPRRPRLLDGDNPAAARRSARGRPETTRRQTPSRRHSHAAGPEPGSPTSLIQKKRLGGKPSTFVFPSFTAPSARTHIQGLFELAGIAYVGSGVSAPRPAWTRT